MKKVALVVLVGAVACVSVSKSVLDSSYGTNPVPQANVTVFLQTDTVPSDCERVAILHASGTNSSTEGQIIDKLRAEAGKLGANAIHIQSQEDAGTGERALAAIFGTPSDKDWDALAIHCPGT